MPSTLIAIAVSLLTAFGLAVLMIYVFARRQSIGRSDASRFEEILRIFDNRLHNLQQQIDTRMSDQRNVLSQTQERIGSRLDGAAQVIGQVQNSLGQLEEANKRIYEVGKDIRGLQDILRAPKQRGVLGELILGDLLTQILPNDHFQLQYSFKNNEKVDAIICLAQGLVPIDAKFPLENFKRFWNAQSDREKEEAHRLLVADTKKHIETIASKYIVPDEGTLDFALMYIPAENVYYELSISDYQIAGQQSLIQYALHKRVIPVSPNTLFAYLQTILLGLRGLKIEEHARSIQEMLGRLRLDFGKLDDEISTLGKHLASAVGAYDRSRKKFDQIHARIGTIENHSPPVDQVAAKQEYSFPQAPEP
ncbi:MAG: DNA recombination protein RmuC [Candidatus Omnitrophica bacterium]|nr:DNA recombination protein RmuC [Candidatus Omnitrophota bacterium]